MTPKLDRRIALDRAVYEIARPSTAYERFEREEAQRRGPRVLTTMLLAAVFWAGFVAVAWEFWRQLAGGGQ